MPNSDADALSQALASAVQSVQPAVVRVHGGGRMHGSGTVWRQDRVVTAGHIVRRPTDLVIVDHRGKDRSATLLGRDRSLDLAVLKIDPGDLEPAPRRALGDIGVGHLTVALGRPGKQIRGSLRMVGLRASNVPTPAGGELTEYLETDRTIPRGFSGGPLVDTAGAVLGINTSGLLRWADVTVPCGQVDASAAEIEEHGSVRHGYLGVSCRAVALPDDLAGDATSGCMVVTVEPDSPAARGGIILGDVLLAIGGKETPDPRSLATALRSVGGKRVEVALLRGGESKTLEVDSGFRG